MKLIVDKKIDFFPSVATVVDSIAGGNNYGVVFEIDDATAYFYAVYVSKDSQNIVDALHIYNTKNVTDNDIQSTLKIDWSENFRYAVLFINEYAHAIFDFKEKQGYCRTAFPQGVSQSGWSKKDKTWNDSILDLFRS
jgi:hypothetical protein